MLVYKNISEFVRQVIHPFSNNLRLLIDDAQQRIDDTIKLIESIKKEILQLIDTIRDQLIDLSIRHDKDVEDLNDRCDQIVNDYQQADKDVVDRVDDVISGFEKEFEIKLSQVGTTVCTQNTTYVAKRTGPHFVLLVGGGGGGAGKGPAVTIHSGAGGSGEVRLAILPFTKDVSYNVIVGAAGRAGNGSSDRGNQYEYCNGGNGGASYIAGFEGAIANGGGGGLRESANSGGGFAGGWLSNPGDNGTSPTKRSGGRNITYYFGYGGEPHSWTAAQYGAEPGRPGGPGVVIIFD